MYCKALDLMKVSPNESVMAGAHAYDLRAAKKVFVLGSATVYAIATEQILIFFSIGLKIVYVQRSIEDLDEEVDDVRKEVDVFLDVTKGCMTCGLSISADILGA